MSVIKKVNLSEQVLDYLLKNIEDGHWKLQEKLPNEIELSSTLNVSRNVLREAMKVLENFEIIEGKPGKGTFVCANALNNISTYNYFKSIRNTPSVESILEARLVVESYTIKKVATNLDENQKEILLNLREIELQKIEDRNYTFDDDLNFHSTLAKMCGNNILENLIISTLEKLRNTKYTQIKDYVPKDVRYNSAMNHIEIIDSVIAKDGEKASAILYSHLSNRIAYIQEKSKVNK